MRFRLIDKNRKEQLHEGVMPSTSRPEIVTWGNRAFLFDYYTGEKQDIPVYVETSAYRIGSFGR